MVKKILKICRSKWVQNVRRIDRDKHTATLNYEISTVWEMKPRTVPQNMSRLLMGTEQELNLASYMMMMTTTTTTTMMLVMMMMTKCFAKQNDRTISTASYIMSLGYGYSRWRVRRLFSRPTSHDSGRKTDVFTYRRITCQTCLYRLGIWMDNKTFLLGQQLFGVVSRGIRHRIQGKANFSYV